MEARLSPDSRFLAYRSDETGRNEIFVRAVAFPGDVANLSVEQWQVSTDGGLGMVSWRRDGQELYYFGADKGVMAVDVTTAPEFQIGTPRLLFRLTGSGPSARPGNQYVGPNGQRFVFVRPVVADTSSP